MRLNELRDNPGALKTKKRSVVVSALARARPPARHKGLKAALVPPSTALRAARCPCTGVCRSEASTILRRIWLVNVGPFSSRGRGQLDAKATVPQH